MNTPLMTRVPPWQSREQWTDLTWLAPYLYDYFLASVQAYQQLGRGALVIDTTFCGQGGATPAAYFTQSHLVRYVDSHCDDLVATYRPQDELVAILLKDGQRSNAYRLRSH